MTKDTNTASGAASGQFTKKPVTIDAWLIDFGNKPLPQWVHDAFLDDVIDWCPAGEGLYINTLEGHMLGGNGDWLIRGVKGEMYACKPDIFEATYTRAALASAPAQPVAEPANADSVLEDAARYRLVRRGQHWSVIDGIGNDLRAEALDTAVDAASKQGVSHDR